jgi:hypothetical protein
MVSELQADKNSFLRLFERFSRESAIVILASIAIIVGATSWFRAERAIDLANAAQATAETWQTLYSETERECRLAQMEIDNFKIMMAKAGLNVDHHGEKP